MIRDDVELLPCPFCGSDMSSFGGPHKDSFARSGDGALAVNCECGTMGPFKPLMAEAVAAWNTRAMSQPTLIGDAELVRRLREWPATDAEAHADAYFASVLMCEAADRIAALAAQRIET